VSNALVDYWQRYRTLPGLQRELVTLGLMLLLALTLLPVAIFIAGQVFLGDYIRDPTGSPTGGFWAFWGDFLRGLGAGSLGHWLVLLGPWLLLLGWRGIRALLRRNPAEGRTPPPKVT
jgi:hypothetical protein